MKKIIFSQSGSLILIILCKFYNFQLVKCKLHADYLLISSKLKPEYIISQIKLHKQFYNIDANGYLKML